jgi:hypothetical protein
MSQSAIVWATAEPPSPASYPTADMPDEAELVPLDVVLASVPLVDPPEVASTAIAPPSEAVPEAASLDAAAPEPKPTLELVPCPAGPASGPPTAPASLAHAAATVADATVTTRNHPCNDSFILDSSRDAFFASLNARPSPIDHDGAHSERSSAHLSEMVERATSAVAACGATQLGVSAGIVEALGCYGKVWLAQLPRFERWRGAKAGSFAELDEKGLEFWADAEPGTKLQAMWDAILEAWTIGGKNGPPPRFQGSTFGVGRHER